MIMEQLRAFFLKFPEMQKRSLGIDCLSSHPESFSIDSVPCETVVTHYMDGSTVRRFLFTISSRCYFGSDLEQQRENLEFFEDLEGWLFQNSMLGNLPELGGGKTVRALTVTSSAYPIEVAESSDGTLARYQMSFELIYLQEVQR